MNFNQYTWRDALQDSALKSSHKLVGLTMLRWVNQNGLCFPSQTLVAEKSSMSERGVRNALKGLEAAGFMQVNVSRGPGQSSRYVLTIPANGSGIQVETEEEPANGSGYNRQDVPVEPVIPANEDVIPANNDTNTGTSCRLTNKELTITTSSAEAETKVETITDVWKAIEPSLNQIIDSPSFDGKPLKAYLLVFNKITAMAPNLSHLSKNPANFLTQKLISHAVTRYFPEIEGKNHARLYKAANQLGSQGGLWIITGIIWSASAQINGDPTSYIIRVSQSKKEEAA